ncbi:hypothetical protein AtEden1_Chr5g0101181 [Arabidopsis thaliana]
MQLVFFGLTTSYRTISSLIIFTIFNHTTILSLFSTVTKLLPSCAINRTIKQLHIKFYIRRLNLSRSFDNLKCNP